MGKTPSPKGESVCGPARRRMRGCVSAATRKRTVLASLPLISRLRAEASPKGEAGDFYFDSFLSSALLVSQSFWLRST